MRRANAHAGADPYKVLERLKPIAARFAEECGERQRRRELVQADFDELCDAGYLLCVVPTDQGGMWRDVQHSMRPICEMLRTLAHGDPSVALVASMHPAVMLTGNWLTAPEAPAPYADVWEEQRRWALVGHHHVRAGQRRRHGQDKGRRASRPVRWGIPRLRPKAFRQRLGDYLVHDHDRDP